MRKIAEHIAEAFGAGVPLVLVAVAGSRDSTPRNAGAQMLCPPRGWRAALLAVVLLRRMHCLRTSHGGRYAHRVEDLGLDREPKTAWVWFAVVKREACCMFRYVRKMTLGPR